MVVVAIAGLLMSTLVWRSSEAAWTATTTNANTFTAGTVQLSAGSTATALFSVTNATAGSLGTACIVVSYTGTVTATAHLYLKTADLTGTGLAPYLDLQVSEGSGSSASCSDFTISGTPLYNPNTVADTTYTLSGFSAAVHDYASGVDAWTAAPGSTRTYKFAWQLQDNSAELGLTAGATFTWEAQT